MLTPVPCNFQFPSCFKVFDLFLLSRSFSIEESPKPRSSYSCNGTCSEFRASPLQRAYDLALLEYFSLFGSLCTEQENWFESSLPAQQIVLGCFETWKHSMAGMVVHVSGSWAQLRGCVLTAVGLPCSVSWHKQLEKPFWLKAEWGTCQFVLPAICVCLPHFWKNLMQQSWCYWQPQLQLIWQYNNCQAYLYLVFGVPKFIILFWSILSIK